MRFNEVFKGAFLKSADLGGKARKYTIASLEMETVGEDSKPVVRFEETDQALVLNKTNGGVLRDELGDEMSDWVGQVIFLRPDKTDYQGKRVDCIRVALPPSKNPAPATKLEQDDDETI